MNCFDRYNWVLILGLFIGHPLPCNHCQGTQTELIKEVLIDIDIYNIYIVLEYLEVHASHTDVHIHIFQEIDVCLSSGGFQLSYTNLDMTSPPERRVLQLYNTPLTGKPAFTFPSLAVNGEVTGPSQLS